MKKKKQECLDLKKTRLVSQVLVQFTVILGVFLINSSCSALKLNSKKSQPQPDYGGYGDAEAKPILSLYADCSEIQADIRSQLEMRKNNDVARWAYYHSRSGIHGARMPKSAPDAAVSSMATSDQANPSNEFAAEQSAGQGGATNVQEQGVDESDFVKIGSDHIFVHRDAAVKVSDRATLKELGEVSVADLTHVNLYADGSRLTVIGFKQGPSSELGPRGELVTFGNRTILQSDGDTIVRIYATAKGKLPGLVKEHFFRGDYLDTRLLEGQLLTVFRGNLPMVAAVVGEVPHLPVALDQGSTTINGVACSAIAKPIIRDVDLRMSRLAVINTVATNKAVQQMATVGGGDMIYMTTRNIYLVKQNRTWWPWVQPANDRAEEAYWQPQQNSEAVYLTKVSLTRDGQLLTTAVGRVPGRVKDQWAFKELADDNLLSVATTTGQLWAEGDQKALNHLYILEQSGSELKTAAPVQDFAPGEDIRSVRHVDKIAYIVTFKKTDPLFAFDLSQPRAPKILGELKIPGFSTYMHPLADGRLLGIGFDAIEQGGFALFDGIQVSLFDTSNPRELGRLDHHTLGKRGSGSDVTGDHHAFYYDVGTKLIGVPVVMVNDDRASNIELAGQATEFSGAVLYRLEGDKLNELTRISHADLMPPGCKRALAGTLWWQDRFQSLDINRMYTLDGRLISISRFGIKSHELQDPDKVTGSTVFSRAGEELCISRPPVMIDGFD